MQISPQVRVQVGGRSQGQGAHQGVRAQVRGLPHGLDRDPAGRRGHFPSTAW
jgi:hypothetical protein